MSKLLINEHPLQVLPTLAMAIGLNEAIFLQQLHYWLTPDNKYQPHYMEWQGKVRPWVFNTYHAKETKSGKITGWGANFPFWSSRTIKRITANLKEMGLIIVTDAFNERATNRTLWYTIDYNRLKEIETKIADSDNVSPSTVTMCPPHEDDNVSPSNMTDCPPHDRDYTENTEETTTTSPDDFGQFDRHPDYKQLVKFYQKEVLQSGTISSVIASDLDDILSGKIDKLNNQPMPIELVLDACREMIRANNRDIRYLLGVLSNWQKRGGKPLQNGSNGKTIQNEDGSYYL